MADEKPPANAPNALAITFKMTPEFAANAFDAALQQDTKNRTNFVMSQMTSDMEKMRELQYRADIINRSIAFYERRLLATKAGAFTIDARDRIVFTDDSLNQSSIANADNSTTFL